jgi:hypothetical protein
MGGDEIANGVRVQANVTDVKDAAVRGGTSLIATLSRLGQGTLMGHLIAGLCLYSWGAARIWQISRHGCDAGDTSPWYPSSAPPARCRDRASSSARAPRAPSAMTSSRSWAWWWCDRVWWQAQPPPLLVVALAAVGVGVEVGEGRPIPRSPTPLTGQSIPRF